MTSTLVARNTAQKLGEIVLNLNGPVVTGSSLIIYTCPAGKRAEIKGHLEVTTTGAADRADLNIAGIDVAEWQATGGGTILAVPQDLAEGVAFPFEQIMDAGETIVISQNSGTNANFRGNIKIKELPI